MIKKFKLISSQEGKILITGILLLTIYLITIIGLYLLSADDANNLVGMTITNFFFGRAAGISYGFAVEFSDSYIILINIIIELIIVLIVYPLFVFSWNRSLNTEFFKNIVLKVEEQRVKYKYFFDKYGKYGLFLFVWFPFWMTGPVIGSIIGFLIGIRHYTTMIIVLTGTSLAIVIWTLFLKELINLLNQISSYGPHILLSVFVLIIIILKNKKD